jgi:hypothetical protein
VRGHNLGFFPSPAVASKTRSHIPFSVRRCESLERLVTRLFFFQLLDRRHSVANRQERQPLLPARI